MQFINNILNTLRNTTLAAGLILAGNSCFAQSFTIMDMKPVPAVEGAVASIGEYVAGGEMPRPEWRDENGKQVARLVLKSETAAAWRLNFQALNLPEGAQMFLYGSDANGAQRAIHGPYEGHGPVNVPEFSSDLVAGSTLTIEIRGGNGRMDSWPFTLDSVEQVNAARLTELQQNGLKLEARVQPVIRKSNANPDIRTAYIGDRLVKYEVIDGEAVVEGDMVIGRADQVGTFGSTKSTGKKEGHITTYEPWIAYWPAGQVPIRVVYSGSGMITKGSTLDQNIQAAITHWNSFFSNILIGRTNEVAYVSVEFKSGVCQANSIGRNGGQVKIEVDNSCSPGNIIHEIGHALGMHHEHTRPDRNTYVTVNTGNILSDKTHNFDIPDSGESTASGAYDFGSIMHYPVNAFSSNGNNTLTIKGTVPVGVTVGQRTALSVGDRGTIQSLYCSGVTTKGPDLIEFDAEGGSSSFTFTAPGYCARTITAPSWIKITSPTTGFGSGVVNFTVEENTGRYPRSGSIRYNGRSTVIRQIGVGVFGKQF